MDFDNFEPHELIVLAKALFFIKFRSHETDVSEIAGSPYLGEMYMEVIKNLWMKSGRISSISSDYWQDKLTSLEQDRHTLESIKNHITNTIEWNNMSEQLKIGYIKDLINPLPFQYDTVDKLLKFGNLYHNLFNINY